MALDCLPPFTGGPRGASFRIPHSPRILPLDLVLTSPRAGGPAAPYRVAGSRLAGTRSRAMRQQATRNVPIQCRYSRNAHLLTFSLLITRRSPEILSAQPPFEPTTDFVRRSPIGHSSSSIAPTFSQSRRPLVTPARLEKPQKSPNRAALRQSRVPFRFSRPRLPPFTGGPRGGVIPNSELRIPNSQESFPLTNCSDSHEASGS
jgi:hypothetical protein